jgi:hypothetical protein
MFKRFYIRFMTGTAVEMFDPVGSRLAAKIAKPDRQSLIQLADQGYRMIVLSCGTANLAESTLEKPEWPVASRLSPETGSNRQMVKSAA